MLIALFGFTVLAGLAGAVWELVNISRLLVRDHPEERGPIAYPALTRKIMETHRESDFPAGIPQGPKNLEPQMPGILAEQKNGLPNALRQLLHRLVQHARDLRLQAEKSKRKLNAA